MWLVCSVVCYVSNGIMWLVCYVIIYQAYFPVFSTAPHAMLGPLQQGPSVLSTVPTFEAQAQASCMAFICVTRMIGLF